MQRKKIILSALAVSAVVLAVSAFDVRLLVVPYTITSDKITAPVRIALLTDLHSCAYGKEQATLLDAVHAQQPDLVLFGGDIFDEDMPIDNAVTVLADLGARYPCYYVSGNHEYKFTQAKNGYTASDLFDLVEQAGVTVLSGTADTITLGEQRLTLAGVDDPHAPNIDWLAQMQAVTAQQQGYSILLTHRPERFSDYLDAGFDLSVAGHAHGGQWRIPCLLDGGLLAPHQGFFPEYAGGLFEFDGQNLVVSRGLARESTRIPRIYNRPELV